MNLEEKTFEELKLLARKHNIKGWWAMKEESLIIELNKIPFDNNEQGQGIEIIKEETKEAIYRLKTTRILYKGQRYTREQLDADQKTAKLLYEAGLTQEIEIT